MCVLQVERSFRAAPRTHAKHRAKTAILASALVTDIFLLTLRLSPPPPSRPLFVRILCVWPLLVRRRYTLQKDAVEWLIADPKSGVNDLDGAIQVSDSRVERDTARAKK